jgi:hypothetical protein
MLFISSPGREGNRLAQATGLSPTITHQRRPGGDAAIKYGHDGGLRRVTPQDSDDQATRRRSSSRFQSVVSTPSPYWPPLLGVIPTVEVPIRQLLTDFCASLYCRMQSVFSSPSHATLRPGLEGLTSPCLIGLEKTLQPLYPHGGASSSDLHPPPATVFTPERRVSWGPLSFGKASESDSAGTAPHSWSKVVARSTLPPDSSLPPPDDLLSDPTNAWSPVGPRNRRERKQRVGGTGPVSLASFGKPRSDAPCWSPVEQWSQLPTREEERRCSRGNSLRAGSSCSPLDPKLDLNEG